MCSDVPFGYNHFKFSISFKASKWQMYPTYNYYFSFMWFRMTLKWPVIGPAMNQTLKYRSACCTLAVRYHAWLVLSGELHYGHVLNVRNDETHHIILDKSVPNIRMNTLLQVSHVGCFLVSLILLFFFLSPTSVYLRFSLTIWWYNQGFRVNYEK